MIFAYMFTRRPRPERPLSSIEEIHALRALSEDFELTHTLPGYISKRPELWVALLEAAARSRAQRERR
jgi:hypothetical protein